MGMVQHTPSVNPPAAPLCSVCIANYNGISLLEDCLESVLAQVGGFSIEIIVHDDASTDGSLSLLRERFPQIELLASDKNVGFCVSNNRMATLARGKYILLLNNDAALYPDAVETFIRAAEHQEPKCIMTLPQYDWETRSLVDFGCLLDPFCNPIPNLDHTHSDVAYVIGACLWCPLELWLELGGFPQWMGSLAEDLYLCGIARLRGRFVRALPGSGYRHRQGTSFGGNRVAGGSLQPSIKRRRLSERNKTLALVITTPGIVVWPLLFAHLIALVLEGLALCVLRRNTLLWKEIYGYAIATPFRDFTLWRQERVVQQNRRLVSLAQWFAPTRWRLRKVTMALRYGIPKFH